MVELFFKLNEGWAMLEGKELEADVREMVVVPTAQHQIDAMCSLAAAIGVDTFSKSSLIRKHNQNCFQCAAAQFAAWRNAPGGRELRMKEREIYYYGYQQES